MAEEKIATGWFLDDDGAKFAPKTLVESIQNTTGKTLTELLEEGGGTPATYDPKTETIKLGKMGEGSKTSHTYSTEEQIVGTWINGKPIYERTIEVLSPSRGGSNYDVYDISSFNINKLINIKGVIDNWGIIPLYVASDYYVTAYYSYTREQIVMNVGPNAELYNKNCIIIIQYTKTTD